jgi:glyoxylase-like metal-dependent hydrolase (beta-lactamase superfamily II)
MPRFAWLVVLVVAGLAVWAFTERRALVMYAFALSGPREVPALLPPPEEGPSTRWIDDYFTVELVAPRTWAIGEPRYAQQNYSYLIEGAERALLFDAGPGIRDIRASAESLTDRPIVFLPSHFHYDHVGNDITFDTIAVVDLPYLRAREQNGRLTLTTMEHLGMAEGFGLPTWKVDHWWSPGTVIDLGGRTLTLLYTPGHTTDSISLLDAENRILFSADYLYPGELYGFLPNSSMGDYLTTAESLLAALDEDVVFLGAHRVSPPGPPRLRYRDLVDLESGLSGIRDRQVPGSTGYPSRFPINDRLVMLAEPRWLQRW